MGCLSNFFGDGKNKLYDHLAHFLVFGAIAIMNIVLLSEHPDSRIITAIGAVALGTSLTSALYHLGLMAAINSNTNKKEMESGKALRNLLTTLTLVFVGVGIGVQQKVLNIDIFDAKPDGNDDNKQLNLLGIQFIFLLVARLLDVFFDLVEVGLEDVLRIQCDKKEEQRFCDIFTGRILVTHALLLSATIMTGMLTEGDNKLEGLDDTEQGVLILTLILLIVHTGLYPLVALLHMLFLNKETGQVEIPFIGSIKECCSCGRKEECKEGLQGRGWDRVRNYVRDKNGPQYTLESLNRMPLVRTLVSTVILAVISVLAGHTLQNARAQLVLIVLTLYVAADAIGRNVV